VLDGSEAKDLHVGDIVSLGTKAFAPMIQKMKEK
jgi:molybdate transport system ATP-binding protein